MALPSAVTFVSVTVVAAAGVGLVVAAASSASEDSASGPGDAAVSHATAPAVTTGPTSRITAPRRSKAHNRQSAVGPAHRRRADAVPKVLVEVYNNSGITGLASEKATLLQGAGWNVAATDNWYGDIASNTVYYPADLRRDAKQLAKLLHIRRLRPAVAPMQFDRLTVIFTSP